MGIELNHGYPDMCRAVMEGTAYVLRQMLENLENAQKGKMEKVFVIGGGSKSDAWRQILANVFQRPITCTTMTQEANSWGAAICGGVCVGLWKDVSTAQKLVKTVSVNQPDIQTEKVYNEIFKVFKQSFNSMIPTFDNLSEIRDLLNQ